MQKSSPKANPPQAEKIKIMNREKGFTLAEMLVSVTIFFIALTICINIFVSAIKLQKYSLSSQRLIDQTNYAFEYMARMIRMAVKDDSGTCIASGNNYQTSFNIAGTSYAGLMFRDSSGKCRAFFVDGNVLKEYEPNRSPSIINLISNEFTVSNLSFYIPDSGIAPQPRVTIFFDITANNMNPAPRMRIQTTISQRNLNL
jgi:type II secretory pathway pseudopilin PulG